MELNKVYLGDSLEIARTIPDNFLDCVVTSPPYYALRDYGHEGQIGLEKTPEAYIEKLVSLFREIRRALKPNGTCWVNLGDCYAGSGKGQNGNGRHSNGGKQDTNAGAIVGGLPRGVTGGGYKEQRPHRYSVDVRICYEGRWLVSAPRHHLVEA